jgi:hypothetical protein
MWNFGKPLLQVSVLLLLGLSVALAATTTTPPPTIFFTDLTSGPNSGGESVSGYAGAYVTLYGNNFGTSPTVTLNGASCLRIVAGPTTWLWYQKMVVQLNSSCASGNFVVTSSAGGSNVSPFTVRSGNIYCVSTSGNDNNSGKFPNCWQTIVQGRQISPGDITYVENGVSQTTTDGYASLTVNGTCTSSAPCALVGYPGATATIGSTSNDGVRFCTGLSSCGNGGTWWIFANLTLRGANTAWGASVGATNIYVIGSDISCPDGNQQTGCITTNQAGPVYVYGNNIHDIGYRNTSVKTYHAVYLGGDSTPVYPGDYVAWNEIYNTYEGRGIQIRPNSGGLYDIHVHDNVVYNTVEDAIETDDIDPVSGPVEIYNNLVYDYGNDSGCALGGTYLGIRSGPSSTGGNVLIYNNTIGPANGTCVGTGNNVASILVEAPSTVWNNVFLQASTQAYLMATCSDILTGSSNNSFYGAGTNSTCSSNFTNNVTSDPSLVDPYAAGGSLSGLSFLPSSSSSPIVGAGSTSPSFPPYDINGLLRPSPPSIGAYEYTAGAAGQIPAAPTGLTAVVQ